MPAIAIGAAAYAAGLILGFGGVAFPVMLGGAVAVAAGVILRRPRAWGGGACAVAGALVAGADTRLTRSCLAAAATDTVFTVVLGSRDAAAGGFVRATLQCAGGAHAPIAVAVRTGRAPAGATVAVTGAAVGGPRGVVVQGARLRPIAPPPWTARWRARAIRVIERDFGPAHSPLAKALLVADTRDLSPQVRDRFADSGLVHILSISGLHITLVAAAIVLLFEALRFPRALAAVAGVGVTAAYVAGIGAPPPAVRSAAMFGALVATRLAQRNTSPWAVLAVGSAWPLAEPRVAVDLGWQLSVIGMIALTVAGRLDRRWFQQTLSRRRRAVAAAMAASVIASFASAPLVAWHFGRVSLVAPLANLVAAPIAGVLQPALFLTLAAAPWPAVSGLAADACRPLLAALDGAARLTAGAPGAALDVAPTSWVVGLLLAASAAFLAAGWRRHPARPLAVGLTAVALAVWVPAAPRPTGRLELHVLDVGQGDAIALRTPAGRWALVDAGPAWRGGDAGRRVVVPAIRRSGGAVALFALSHPDLDHVGGAPAVVRYLRPAAFWDAAYVAPTEAYRQALALAGARRVAWRRPAPGDSLVLDGVVLTALGPDSAWTASGVAPNDASLVIRVRYGGRTALLTGDAEAAQEQWLVARYGDALRAEVLKAGHHGSRTSSTPAFVAAVRPAVAVISAGLGNRYGHPHPDVVRRLAQGGAVVLRTDLLGAVVLETDGASWWARADGERWFLR